MTNELKVGDRRHGGLFDDNPETPSINAVLERTDKGIFVSIHWDSEKSPATGRWFTNDAFYRDQTDQTEHERPAPKVPSELIFQDSNGEATLVGCRGAGYHTNFFIGTGLIRVGAAVLGATSSSYREVNGLRSEVSGLRAWLGTTSINTTHTYAKEDGLRKTSVVVTSPEPISIPGTSIILRPTYSYTRNHRQGSFEIRDVIQVEHTTEQESPWRGHIGAQRAIRDLLAISRWRDESLIPTAVFRQDDPIESVDGTPSQREKWLKVLDDSSDSPKEENTRIAHFIEYAELGPNGVARWISLRNDFSRAIDPAVSSIYLQDVTAEVRLTQIAIALEALGYLIAIRDDGASEATARNLSFRQRIERIADDVEGVLPFIIDGWSQRVADSYNAVKHANRALPDAAEVANGWRECVLLFRVWVARKLGVDATALQNRASTDKMANPYVLAE